MNFDKTYCTGDGCKYFGPCHRSLTHEVMTAARYRFRDADARVSRFEFPEKLPCWESDIETEEDEN